MFSHAGVSDRGSSSGLSAVCVSQYQESPNNDEEKHDGEKKARELAPLSTYSALCSIIPTGQGKFTIRAPARP